MAKQDPPFFWVEDRESFGLFLIFSRKSVSASRLHGVCMGRNGKHAQAVFAGFTHICCVGSFCDLGIPVLPTLNGVSADVLLVEGY